MMPDLGSYALWVLSAYGLSLALLAAITLLSILQARRTRRALQRMEEGRAATSGARRAAPEAGEGAHG